MPPGIIHDMDVYAEGLDRARRICLGLPGAYQEQAWMGIRWMVRKRTFAHLLEIVDGLPRSFAASAGTKGPAAVLTFRAEPGELGAILSAPGSFGPLWGRTDVGVRLPTYPDRDELAELLVDIYRLRAPLTLVRGLEG